MNLGSALTRLYDVLGDDKNDPQDFTRTRLVTLLNEGVLTFRQMVEDRWMGSTIEVTAGQRVYTKPTGSISRPIRIAFDDVTMAPSSIQELSSIDDKWETRQSSRPCRWTSQGLSHDEFGLYPVPDTSTAKTFEFSSETGALGAYFDAAGAFATFNQETGIVIQLEDDGETINFLGNTGALGHIEGTGADAITYWGVERPTDMVQDTETIPCKIGYHMAPVYYTLWQVHEEEGDHFNAQLAEFYRAKFMERVERARIVSANPLPLEKHTLRSGPIPGVELAGRPPSPWSSKPAATLPGASSAVSIGWPRRGYF